MVLEDELRRAFDTLTDRLRDEVRRHLAEATPALTTAVETTRAEAAAQARAATQQEAALALATAEQEFAAVLVEAQEASEQRGREAGRQDGFVAGRQVGYDAGRQDGFSAGREEGLALGREQGREEARQEGRQEGRDELRAALKPEAREASQRLVDAIRAIDRGRSLSEILDLLASSASREAARVGVLLVGGAKLRGWRFIGFGPGLEEASAFEIPLAEGGIMVEAVHSGATALAFSGSDRPRPSFAKLPPGRETLAVPVSISGQVVAVLYADQGAGDPADTDSRWAWASVLEVMARHATRYLEATTAFRAAQVLTQRPDVPSSQAFLAPASPRSAGVSDKDGDEDQAARRR